MADRRAPTNTAGIPLPKPPANPPSLSDITDAREYIEKLAHSKASESTNHATSDELSAAEAYKASIMFSHSVDGDVSLGVIDQMKEFMVEIRSGIRSINATLADNKTHLVNMINALDVKVNTLDAKVNMLDEEVNTLDAKVNMLDEKVNMLDAKVNMLDEKVNTLDEKVNTLDEKVNTLNEKIDGHTIQLTEINQRLARLPVIISNAQSGLKGLIRNPFLIAADGSAPTLQPPNPTTYQELLGFTEQQCVASAADLGLPLLPPNATIDARRRQISAALGLLID
ncbi:hypothetical protein JR316_0006412 [Psilocybe cubensis]|uniref:Uncharacterized protein n=2 Tax=Psilocybe cubensis TaxID=181762 RepID=A0A8H7XN12_PSICU|nr:hypothetical protein JR316_0006412 [Psilocybe cubensis]KAH9481882.1 hypothetical protein JR316_0006412 [Psilocybe cubensis]